MDHIKASTAKQVMNAEINKKISRSRDDISIEHNTESKTNKPPNAQHATTVLTVDPDILSNIMEGIRELAQAIIDIRRQMHTMQMKNREYPIGLHNKLETIGCSRECATPQEAIAAANAEEDIKKLITNGARQRYGSNKISNCKNKIVQCYKCGKTGHYGKDCRNGRHANRFSLAKLEKSRVNIINKFCTHCKKRGHNREECWYLHGRPKIKPIEPLKSKNFKPRYDNKSELKRIIKARLRNSESEYSSDEEEKDGSKTKTTRTSEHQVTHVRRMTRDSGLDIVTLPIRETKSEN